MTMIDIGAGTGFFTRPAATIVGPTGRVIALDMSADMLAHLRQHGVPANVQVLHSDEYTLPLSDATADMSFLAFVMHETPDLLRFLKEIERVTKPSGVIAIIDWKKQTEELGPPEEERLDRQRLLDMLKDHGATIHSGNLNASHYYVLIRKTAT
jgi:ubiquinone/menaquinone biosynthesis C-methylase UbiE